VHHFLFLVKNQRSRDCFEGHAIVGVIDPNEEYDTFFATSHGGNSSYVSKSSDGILWVVDYFLSCWTGIFPEIVARVDGSHNDDICSDDAKVLSCLAIYSFHSLVRILPVVSAMERMGNRFTASHRRHQCCVLKL
jgi:hypothetical protein